MQRAHGFATAGVVFAVDVNGCGCVRGSYFVLRFLICSWDVEYESGGFVCNAHGVLYIALLWEG